MKESEGERQMRLISKLVGFALLTLGVAMVSPAPTSVPEINPSAGINALALISGVLLILRSRKT
jgi:hypothetical protein